MIQLPLGDTGISVSAIGLGTVKLGRNTGVKYPQHFNIPDDQQALKILEAAKECGINLIDTAPAYGQSETRLGYLLPKVPHEWLICTKVGEYFDDKTGESSFDFTPEGIEKSLENSFRLLQREVLDIVLIHSDGQDKRILDQGALEVLNHYKQKGWIRATGMSTKTIEGGIEAANRSDVVMVTHNLNYQGEQAVIDYCGEINKGVLIKKAFASGHSANNSGDFVFDSFHEIYRHQSISSVVIGSINPKHLRENASKAEAVLSQLND